VGPAPYASWAFGRTMVISGRVCYGLLRCLVGKSKDSHPSFNFQQRRPYWVRVNATPAHSSSQLSITACPLNMSRSSLGKLDSSALRACMEHGGSDRGAVDVSKGAGPTEGLARS